MGPKHAKIGLILRMLTLSMISLHPHPVDNVHAPLRSNHESATEMVKVYHFFRSLQEVQLDFYIDRVATQSGNQGKQGKWPKQIPYREKSGNFKI